MLGKDYSPLINSLQTGAVKLSVKFFLERLFVKTRLAVTISIINSGKCIKGISEKCRLVGGLMQSQALINLLRRMFNTVSKFINVYYLKHQCSMAQLGLTQIL